MNETRRFCNQDMNGRPPQADACPMEKCGYRERVGRAILMMRFMDPVLSSKMRYHICT